MKPDNLEELENETLLDASSLAAITGGYHGAPVAVPGMHSLPGRGRRSLVVRTFQPQAAAVSVLRNGTAHTMRRAHPEGLFEAVFPGETEFFPYRLSITLPERREY